MELDERLLALLNSPTFQIGASLLGASRSQAPLASALGNVLDLQHQTQLMDLQRKKGAYEEREANARVPLYEAQTKNMESEAASHAAEMQMMQQRQAMLQKLFGSGLFGGGGGGGNAVPQGQPAPAMIPQPDEQNPLVRPPMTPTSLVPQQDPRVASTLGENGLFGQMPPGVDPRAAALELILNQGKNLPAMLNKAQEPITTANGMVYNRGPSGDVSIAPGSLDALRKTTEMEQAVKGGYGTVELPMSNGQSITLSPTEWRTYQMNNQLPPRYGGGAAQPRPEPQAPVAPQSQAAPSSGFSLQGSFGTPPGILDNLKRTESSGNTYALNKDTKALGPYQFTPETLVDLHKRGVVFNPLDEKQARAAADWYLQDLSRKNGGDLKKAVAAYGGFVTKNPAGYQQKVLGNAAAAPVPGSPTASDISAPAAPTIGVTQAPTEIASAEAQGAQQKAAAESWQKRLEKWQENSIQAGGRSAQMSQLMGYLDKVKPGLQNRVEQPFYQMASAAGFQVPKEANYAQAIEGLSDRFITELREQGANPLGQMTNYEDRIVRGFNPSLYKMPWANKILGNAYLRLQQRTQDIEKIMTDYKEHHGMLDDGVMGQIRSYKNDNPLFNPQEAQLLQAHDAATQGGSSKGRQRSDVPVSNREAVGKITPFGAKPTPVNTGIKFLGFE